MNSAQAGTESNISNCGYSRCSHVCHLKYFIVHHWTFLTFSARWHWVDKSPKIIRRLVPSDVKLCCVTLMTSKTRPKRLIIIHFSFGFQVHELLRIKQIMCLSLKDQFRRRNLWPCDADIADFSSSMVSSSSIAGAVRLVNWHLMQNDLLFWSAAESLLRPRD